MYKEQRIREVRENIRPMNKVSSKHCCSNRTICNTNRINFTVSQLLWSIKLRHWNMAVTSIHALPSQMEFGLFDRIAPFLLRKLYLKGNLVNSNGRKEEKWQRKSFLIGTLSSEEKLIANILLARIAISSQAECLLVILLKHAMFLV